MLITVDVGHTLGEFDRPGTADILREIAEAPTHAAEVDRTLLHVVPELTPGIARHVRELLLIPDHAWPDTWHTGGFTPYPGTLAALPRLAAIAPVVALTNVSCIAGPRRPRRPPTPLWTVPGRCVRQLPARCPKTPASRVAHHRRHARDPCVRDRAYR